VTSTAAPAWAGLVDDLTKQGVLGPQWRSALLAVPREVFIPDVIWRYDGDELVPLRRGEEPAEWLARVHGPRHAVTQVDYGPPAGPPAAS